MKISKGGFSRLLFMKAMSKKMQIQDGYQKNNMLTLTNKLNFPPKILFLSWWKLASWKLSQKMQIQDGDRKNNILTLNNYFDFSPKNLFISSWKWENVGFRNLSFWMQFQKNENSRWRLENIILLNLNHNFFISKYIVHIYKG